MKKLISLVLVLVMICSLSVSVFAANETSVTYVGQGVESFTVTVPAALTPDSSGAVRVEGTWASNRVVSVTCPDSVTMTNNIDGGTKVLDVYFDGISRAGDNENSITVSEEISVEDISNALFGTWSGTINYDIEITNTLDTPLVFGREYVCTHWTWEGEAYVFYEDGSCKLGSDETGWQYFDAGTCVYEGTDIVFNGRRTDNIDYIFSVSEDGQTVYQGNGMANGGVVMEFVLQ